MNPFVTVIPPRPAPLEQPFVAPGQAAALPGDPQGLGKMLADLLNDESALYAITRDWRYNAAGRKFLRLHALLDEQFSEIGVRLTKLAARSRNLGSWNSTGQRDQPVPARATAPADPLEAHMIRELLGLHETLIGGLKRGSAAAVERFHDRVTADLLADLTAQHEKDAFMLRALLWEVENVTP